MVETVLQYLINNLSYFGVFISSIITSASIIFPLPGQLILVFAVTLKLNFLLTAIIAATGSMIGEMTGYGLGLVGGKAIKVKFRKHEKLVKTIKKYYSKYAFWVIFIAAFLIFPFDLVGIISGVSRYDVKKFLLAGFFGKFLKTLVLLILIQNGVHISEFMVNLIGL